MKPYSTNSPIGASRPPRRDNDAPWPRFNDVQRTFPRPTKKLGSLLPPLHLQSRVMLNRYTGRMITLTSSSVQQQPRAYPLRFITEVILELFYTSCSSCCIAVHNRCKLASVLNLSEHARYPFTWWALFVSWHFQFPTFVFTFSFGSQEVIHKSLHVLNVSNY